MILKKTMGKQFRKPWGPLGHLAVKFMEKNNRDKYEKVVEWLEIRDADNILEIGFGSGLAIRQMVAHNSNCRITGIDFSKLMLGKARRNNRDAIERRQVRLILADFGKHDFGKETFTKIFGINVIYFWEDLPAMFGKLHGLLAQGGRLIFFMSSPERLNQMPFTVDGVFHKRTLETAKRELELADFKNIRHQVVVKQGQETYYLCAEK